MFGGVLVCTPPLLLEWRPAVLSGQDSHTWTAVLVGIRRKLRATAQRPDNAKTPSGYLAPSILMFEEALSMSRNLPGVSSTSAAPRFSSRRDSFVVPGIGTSTAYWQAAKQEARAEQVSPSFVEQICPGRSTKALVRSTVLGVKAWDGVAEIRAVPSENPYQVG